ncbi:MAG: hypothetical protein ACN6OZ_14935, partial [Stenotrophomonas sp.]
MLNSDGRMCAASICSLAALRSRPSAERLQTPVQCLHTTDTMAAMQITRTLAVLAALLAAVAAWLIVSMPPPEMRVVQGAQMAPAIAGASGGLPTHPPQNLAWRPLDQQQLAQWRGPYWLRWQVPAPESGADHGRTVRLSLRAASHLYWNGMPWISNGVVGRTPEEETPGRVDVVRVLPPA